LLCFSAITHLPLDRHLRDAAPQARTEGERFYLWNFLL
jgi:hypothetical protein